MLHSLVSAVFLLRGLACPALGMPEKVLGEKQGRCDKAASPPCSDTANIHSVLQSPTDDSKLRQDQKAELHFPTGNLSILQPFVGMASQ